MVGHFGFRPEEIGELTPLQQTYYANLYIDMMEKPQGVNENALRRSRSTR